MKDKKPKEEKVTTGDIEITSVQSAGKHSRMIILPKKMCIDLGIEVGDALQIVKKEKRGCLVISKVPVERLG